ncbi:MAG: hypothetical protein WCO52_05615 [bacterium]
MAELMQLDRAAAAAGKSEVTLRRLIKAGKIPFHKEKTLTGFIYMVDPDQVRAFYSGAPIEIKPESVPVDEESDATEPASIPTHAIRVAVAGESGAAHEYWQKKADMYEDKYNDEVVKHSQAREELGVWRGRAEQSQAMLMKLLPASSDAAQPQAPVVPAKEGGGWLMTVLMTVLIVLMAAAAVGAFLYIMHTV